MLSFLEFCKINETAIAPKSTDANKPSSKKNKVGQDRGIGDTIPDQDITEETLIRKIKNAINN